MGLHGNMKQSKRTATFFEFVHAPKGILICTSIAARGLDIPAVDWIIQYDPADDPKEYIHRVGRTARGEGAKGKALLFLLPEELGFLKYLSHARVPLNEYEFPPHKIAKVQSQLENIIQNNFFLNRAAKEAYRSYIQAYSQHASRHIFNVHKLDLLTVAKSFGFDNPPRVHLNIAFSARKEREIKEKARSFARENNGDRETEGKEAVSRERSSSAPPSKTPTERLRGAVRNSKDRRQWSK